MSAAGEFNAQSKEQILEGSATPGFDELAQRQQLDADQFVAISGHDKTEPLRLWAMKPGKLRD